MITDKVRTTSQETIILEHLRSVRTHPTADMIHEAVKKKLPHISKGTVYRNLNKLYAGGKARRLEVDGEFRFDAETHPHIHTICTSCKRISDSFIENIPRYALKRFINKDFMPESVTIIYEGTCRACALKEKKAGTN